MTGQGHYLKSIVLALVPAGTIWLISQCVIWFCTCLTPPAARSFQHVFFHSADRWLSNLQLVVSRKARSGMEAIFMAWRVLNDTCRNYSQQEPPPLAGRCLLDSYY